jgi:hypothetical protein
MFFEWRNLFSKPKKFSSLKEESDFVIQKTEMIKKEQEQLDSFEFDKFKEKGNEFFISFSDFLFFLEQEDYDLNDILARFKHIGELNKEKFSFVEAYATTTKDGIHLSMNPSDKKSTKVKIVSLRTSRK